MTSPPHPGSSAPPHSTLGRLLLGEQPAPGIDWEDLLQVARRHRVSPFLFNALRPHSEVVPDAAWEVLKSDYYAAVARSLFRERQLTQVLDVLNKAGVPVALLKGAALAHTVYPDPALRTMGDIDLWIPREQVPAAIAALAPLGYAPHSKEDRPLGLQDLYGGETQLFTDRPGHGLLELHWNLYPGEWLRHTTDIDTGPVWARTVAVDGLPAQQLSPEDTVLQVASHFSVNHQCGGFGVRPLLDLVLVHRQRDVDWSLVARRAREWRMATAIWLVLDLLAEFFGLDPEVLHLPSLQPVPLRRRLLARLVSLPMLVDGTDLRQGPGRFFYLYLLVDRPRDALRLLWRAIVPERQWLALRYGLEKAPWWRVTMQRLWHPLRVLIHKEV